MLRSVSNGTRVKLKRPFIRGADGLTEAPCRAEGGRTQSWLTSRTQKFPVTLLKHSKRLQHADAYKPWWWLGTGPAPKTKLLIWTGIFTRHVSMVLISAERQRKRSEKSAGRCSAMDSFFDWKACLKQIKSRWVPTYTARVSGGGGLICSDRAPRINGFDERNMCFADVPMPRAGFPLIFHHAICRFVCVKTYVIYLLCARWEASAFRSARRT